MEHVRSFSFKLIRKIPFTLQAIAYNLLLNRPRNYTTAPLHIPHPPSPHTQKMQILLLGATGRTGTPVLLEALQRGHTITALVRNPAALDALISTLPPDQKQNLTLVTGSPLQPSDITKALQQSGTHGHVDVVISTLNARRGSDNPFAAPHPTDSPPRMMADSIANVISALTPQQQQEQQQQQEHSTEAAATTAANATAGVAGRKPAKLVVLSALGAGSSAPHAHWLLRALLRHSNMRFQYEDHDAVEAELTSTPSRAEYVLVRPTRLVEGDEGVARVFDVAGEGSSYCRTVPMMATVSRGAVARFMVDVAEGDQYNGQAPIIVG